jgi:prephenate dehydratase
MSIVVAGHKGSYLDRAAARLDASLVRRHAAGPGEAMADVVSGLASAAVVPLTLPSGNLAIPVLDRVSAADLTIVAELDLTPRTALLGRRGTRRESIVQVAAPWDVAYRCTRRLTDMAVLVRFDVDPVAWMDGQSEGDAAILGPAASARDLGLDLLAEELDDDASVPVRCAVVVRDPDKAGVALRPATSTLVTFSVENESGALHRALSAFAVRNIDLSGLTLRREPLAPHGACTFYATLEAPANDPRTIKAVDHLREFSTQVRVLGNFATWPDPSGPGVGVAPGFEWALPGRSEL